MLVVCHPLMAASISSPCNDRPYSSLAAQPSTAPQGLSPSFPSLCSRPYASSVSDLSDIDSLPSEDDHFPAVSHTIIHDVSSLSSDLSSSSSAVEDSSPDRKQRQHYKHSHNRTMAPRDGAPLSTSEKWSIGPSAKRKRGEMHRQGVGERLRSQRMSVTDEAHKVNDDVCSTCDGVGNLICCERCPKTFHLQCLNPPRDIGQEPDCAWYCNACQTKLQNVASLIPSCAPSLYPLFVSLYRSNPSCYELPDTIKDTFQDVCASPHGDFVNSLYLRHVKYRNGSILPEYFRDYFRTRAEDGSPILCYCCCGQASKLAPILRCDFCPLSWHWDCLNPPMCHPPSPTQKWMCPAHVSHELPPRRAPTSQVPVLIDDRYSNANEPLNETIIAKELFTREQLADLCAAVQERRPGPRRKSYSRTTPDTTKSIQFSFDLFDASSASLLLLSLSTPLSIPVDKQTRTELIENHSLDLLYRAAVTIETLDEL